MNGNDPAFPLATVSEKNREQYVVHQFQTGMSLRAYISSKVLSALWAGCGQLGAEDIPTNSFAIIAVSQADALISELNKEPKP